MPQRLERFLQKRGCVFRPNKKNTWYLNATSNARVIYNYNTTSGTNTTITNAFILFRVKYTYRHSALPENPDYKDGAYQLQHLSIPTIIEILDDYIDFLQKS